MGRTPIKGWLPIAVSNNNPAICKRLRQPLKPEKWSLDTPETHHYDSPQEWFFPLDSHPPPRLSNPAQCGRAA